MFSKLQEMFTKVIHKGLVRIVSISNSYISPNVHDIEVKIVGLGAKVNMFLADGNIFIELLSFDSFHE